MHLLVQRPFWASPLSSLEPENNKSLIIPCGVTLNELNICTLVFRFILFIYPFESESESRSVTFDSLRPHGLYSPWNSPGQNSGVGSISLLQGNLPNPGIESRSPTLQAYSLPAEPQGKPENTWARRDRSG